MKTRTIIAHRNALALAMHEAGESVAAIAAKLERDHSSICNAIRRARAARDAGRTPPPLAPELLTPRPSWGGYRQRNVQGRADAAREYRAAGYSWPEVARLVGYRSHSAAMAAAGRLSGRTR